MARRRGKGSRQPSAGDEVPYEHLTPDVIIGATESFGLECTGSILALGSYENRVYQIGTADGFIVAKFYRPGRWTNAAILEEDHRFSSGRTAVEAVLNRHPETTAIICTSDYHALGVLRGLHEIGKRVPADISVVSFNNNDFSAFTIPSITSVDLKQHDVGIHAANAIYQMLNGKNMKSLNIQPELRIRESSGPVKIKKLK